MILPSRIKHQTSFQNLLEKQSCDRKKNQKKEKLSRECLIFVSELRARLFFLSSCAPSVYRKSTRSVARRHSHVVLGPVEKVGRETRSPKQVARRLFVWSPRNTFSVPYDVPRAWGIRVKPWHHTVRLLVKVSPGNFRL